VTRLSQLVSDRCLLELFHGRGAHVDPIACVEDVSARVANWRGDAYPHSIAQIVSHVNYWMNYDLRRIDGEHPLYPAHAIESWPHQGGVTQNEWQNEIQQFVQLIDRCIAVASSEKKNLQRQVPATHPSHESNSSSVEAVLWQILAHNSYHIGQVALIRRCVGAWPPQRGSDTW